MSSFELYLVVLCLFVLCWIYLCGKCDEMYELTLHFPDTMWNILFHMVSYLYHALIIILALVLVLAPYVAALGRRLVRHLGDGWTTTCHNILSLFSWSVRTLSANRERILIILLPYTCMWTARLVLPPVAGVESGIFYTCYCFILWFSKPNEATCCHVKEEEEEVKPIFDIQGNIC